LAGVLGLGVAACAQVKPFEYTEIHEIPAKPGAFSGEDGEFVLYDSIGEPADTPQPPDLPQAK
jgi:hypothetical protein